jgi:hypothetical protein
MSRTRAGFERVHLTESPQHGSSMAIGTSAGRESRLDNLRPGPRCRGGFSLASLFVLASCGTSTQAKDASADGATDAGSEAPPIADSACGKAVAITAGGSFSGDTCKSDTMVASSGCATPSHASLFELSPEATAQQRVFRVSSGFVLSATLAGECSLNVVDCDGGGLGGASLNSGALLAFAIFRRDGGCGSFVLDVYNASSCSDPTDAGSCTCGTSPACSDEELCSLGGAGFTGTCTKI